MLEADPGFPVVGGANLLGRWGRQHTILQKKTNKSLVGDMKGGGAHVGMPPISATYNVTFTVVFKIVTFFFFCKIDIDVIYNYR